MNTVKFNDSRTAGNMPLAVRFLKVFANYKLLELYCQELYCQEKIRFTYGILAFPLG